MHFICGLTDNMIPNVNIYLIYWYLTFNMTLIFYKLFISFLDFFSFSD